MVNVLPFNLFIFSLAVIIKEIKPEDTWKIRQAVMWPDKPLEFVKVKNDVQGSHYGLFDGNELISVVSCFEEMGELQFRKFATLKHKQKQGFGTSLLTYILGLAKKKGTKRVWCNARVNKKEYYEKFGFKDTNDGFFKEEIEYTIMELRFK